ncbi:MAG TPA: DNA gyrase subunit B, partial [Gemmataceae bacterium]|nr:DNA gyrase subunit B [Gemmataceae bacterium]
MSDSTAVLDTAAVGAANGSATAGSASYTDKDIKHLRNAAHIRQAPGMYIGDTGPKGLHHLAYELVYNSMDEALAGFAKHVNVTVHVDGSISVADDGRGIPVNPYEGTGRSTLEMVLTEVGAGGKFGGSAYRVSAGLHGIGAKAVTALSEWTEARVRRNGRVYMQEFERGIATSELKEMGAAPDSKTGTTITFKPDPEVFHDATFDFDTLENRLRELAFLNKGLAIILLDERTGKKETFHYEGGISEFVAYLNRNDEGIHPVIYVDRTVDNVRVEVAMQYTTGEEERSRAYANTAFNPGGGTHLSGFRAAVTRALNAYGNKQEMFKNVTPIGEDFREGLTAIVNVQVPDPQFESQTKIRLNNPEVEGLVSSVLHEYLGTYLEESPKEAKRILNKVALAAEAREAASKAKKALKDRKNILSGGGLPGKLMDCTTRVRDESELFLVEGQSAGGSAESGRDRFFQAILPLRGKVLNVEKARVEKLLGNEEISCLIAAIGVDIGNAEDVTRLRYGKVIILTDADVDGQHIRTLLLTFFYRQMKRLVEEGRIFVARPPLFAVTQKKNVRFVRTAEEMNKELMDRGLHGTKLNIHADEAHGRMAVSIEGDQLAKLVQALGEVQDPLVILERRGLSIADLLTHKKEDGTLPLYRVKLGGKEHWLHTAEDLDRFRATEQARLGRDLVVSEGEPGASAPAVNGNGESANFAVQELHEVRSLNRGLAKLRELGLNGSDLVPLPRLAGREPPVRYDLEHGDRKDSLPYLRDLPSRVRAIGERGLTVTRFKGLGEMNPEQLWETTLDPKVRTLLRVQLEDALKADEMFRVLMGEKVEPRREFIQKH